MTSVIHGTVNEQQQTRNLVAMPQLHIAESFPAFLWIVIDEKAWPPQQSYENQGPASRGALGRASTCYIVLFHKLSFFFEQQLCGGHNTY